ncbi:MAG: membrane protein insertion efficiency factor YidD [Clostridia bacterium]|nr:membrane protein insertion efficiency factor YidD [Clostridia bacterium]MBQ3482720.1 membrane protein insertion efficiency factor YidD [Clostridia bacterium]
MKHLCIFLIRFYRKCISPLKKSPCCRFTPSCSAYALEAFEKRGFFVGLALTVWRILRCNPYCAGGYDPVPETGFRYKGPRVMPSTDDTRREDGDGCCGHCHGKEEASYREADENILSDETSIQRKEKNQ